MPDDSLVVSKLALAREEFVLPVAMLKHLCPPSPFVR